MELKSLECVAENERGMCMKRIAQVEQGPIEYRVVGQGPVVLVLNGGHANCTSPQHYNETLPAEPFQARQDAFAMRLIGRALASLWKQSAPRRQTGPARAAGARPATEPHLRHAEWQEGVRA